LVEQLEKLTARCGLIVRGYGSGLWFSFGEYYWKASGFSGEPRAKVVWRPFEMV